MVHKISTNNTFSFMCSSQNFYKD